jgi:amino acid adenylation domain-containing protein
MTQTMPANKALPPDSRERLKKLLEQKKVSKAKTFPASSSQQRLWFLDQLMPGNSFYNIAFALRIRGELRLPVLQQALVEIVLRHEVLRTTFETVEGQSVQVVNRPHGVLMPIVDLSGLERPARERQAEALAAQESQGAFDLTRGPLLRVTVLRMDSSSHMLLVTFHHIISDGWSIDIFMREVGALYQTIAAGKPSILPNLPVQYADYSVWQQQWLESSPAARAERDYWSKQLAHITTLEMPTDFPRLPAQTFRGTRRSFRIQEALANRLKLVSQQHGVTLFMTLLAAFQTLLFKYTGQTDIAIGTPVANRGRTQLESLIGFFANTLVLRSDLSGNPTFVEVMARARQVSLNAYTHQTLPFEKVVEDLQPERSLSRTPLFQIAFIFQNTTGSEKTGEIPELQMEIVETEAKTSKFDLTLEVVEGRSGFLGVFEYSIDLFSAATIDRMIEHFQMLLTDIVASPTKTIRQLALLSATEAEQLNTWNATETAYGDGGGQTLVDLLMAQAARTPEQVAVKLATIDTASAPNTAIHQLSYAALAQASNQLAHYLQQLGVGPETRVGVCMDRSVEMVVALIGILKAGGAYVPMDPDYPAVRLAYMLADSNIDVLLTQSHLNERLPATDATIISLDSEWNKLALYPNTAPDIDLTADNLAYIIYTSGSTGQPKGAMNAHRGIVNRLVWMQAEYQLTDAHKVLQKTPFSFDVSVWEFFWPLLNGAGLVMAQPGGHRDADYLVNVIQAEQITTMHFVPSMLDIFLQAQNVEACTSLWQVMCSGETLPKAYVERFYSRLKASLHNLYGPTEAAVDVSYWACQSNDLGMSVPIGKPIANLQLYVLGDSLEQLPVGVSGELYLGGVGLGRGYWARPSLTAERFLPNPYSQLAGERLYRTGDLAKWRGDGVVEYIGRADFQVKIRGYRIELGEIESALRGQDGVRDAVVIAREDTPSDKRLVAYLVASESQTLEVNILRDALNRTLPAYMVPSVFVTLDQLPLSPNGKINRQALPKPQGTLLEHQQTFQPLSSPTEELLAAIWADLLNVQRISAVANFFELGGHSLLATRLVARIREQFGVDVSLRAIFELSTLQAISRTIDVGRQNKTGTQLQTLVPLPRMEALPVSFAQQRLWFIHQLDQNSPAYNAFVAIRLTGTLNAAVLERSVNALVQRHEILRTTYAFKDELVQIVAESLSINLPLIDLTNLDTQEQDRILHDLMATESVAPFDLGNGPIFRTRLVKMQPDVHVFLLALHHINSDAWSFPILFQELVQLYQAFVSGQLSPLPPLPIQYADYAAWQRRWLAGEVLEVQIAYWQKKLVGVSTLLELPTDHPRPPAQTYRGSSRSFQLSKDTTQLLKDFTKAEGATLAMGLLAGFEILLRRYTGQDDFVVGQGIGMRRWQATEGLIGPFINMLLLRASFTDGLTVRQLIRQVRETALDAYDHQDLPFEKLVEVLQPKRDPSYNPLAQVMFVFHNTPVSHIDLTNLQFDFVASEQHSAQFDLLLRITEVNETLMGQLEYNTDLFEGQTVVRMVEHYQTLLSAALQNPAAPVNTLPLLTVTERLTILRDWNETTVAYPAEQTLHQLFETQVLKTPDALAVITPAETLTYAELNQRANQLAHYLRLKGVGPNVTVGLSLERSTTLAVGLMGILKAGGAYVPLDPNYPAERLAYMLQDSGVKVLVAQKHLLNGFPAHEAQVVSIDEDWPIIGQQPQNNPVCNNGPDDLVYVIYTSGSTGRPKGVMLNHRGRVNNFTDFNRRFNVTSTDRLLGISSLSFDMCAYDVLGTLTAGAAVVLPAAGHDYDPNEWLSLIHQHGITLWHSVPSLLSLLVEVVQDQPEQRPHSLRLALLGGDWIPVSLPDRVRAIAPDIKLISLGGATEISMDSTIYDIEDVQPDWRSIPYGHPMANQLSYVLDSHLQPTPIGVPGELHLGGHGVAWGYLNRPDLTAEKFIPNPVGDQPGDRIYKTGDLARWRVDGNLELLGRLDHQVKIHGHRIELGEITSALRRHPSIIDAVVTARRDGGGLPQLVGYVVPEEGTDPSSADLRTYLKQRLPDYMVPNQFVSLAALPLTPNGKLDRKSLPTPNQNADPDREYVAPENNNEALLVATWKDVLGLDRVGVTDDFFELGGDSFKAIRVVNAYRGKLGLLDVFKSPTIRKLALVLANAGDGARRNGDILQLLKQATDVPQATLICLPYDGGNAVIYTPLADALPNTFTVYAVAFPGHDFNRTHEPFESMDVIVGRLMDAIQQQVNGPIVLYGHCGGTATTVEVAQRLEAAGRDVKAIYMGGFLPGTRFSRQFHGLIAKLRGQSVMSDGGMLRFLQSLGAFGEYTDPSQIQDVLDAVRHDAKNATDYFREALKTKRVQKLNAPLICLVASEDPITPDYSKRYKEWEAFSKNVSLVVLEDKDHYFINRRAAFVAETIVSTYPKTQ